MNGFDFEFDFFGVNDMAEKRNTKQKQVIYSIIKELDCHPTAQQLHQILIERGYNIGISTVYRVLADAVEEGIVTTLFSNDKMEHFDGNTNPHYHIICTECGRIYDSLMLYNKRIDMHGGEEDRGFKILTHNLEFIGICPDCQKKECGFV